MPAGNEQTSQGERVEVDIYGAPTMCQTIILGIILWNPHRNPKRIIGTHITGFPLQIRPFEKQIHPFANHEFDFQKGEFEMENLYINKNYKGASGIMKVYPGPTGNGEFRIPLQSACLPSLPHQPSLSPHTGHIPYQAPVGANSLCGDHTV